MIMALGSMVGILSRGMKVMAVVRGISLAEKMGVLVQVEMAYVVAGLCTAMGDEVAKGRRVEGDWEQGRSRGARMLIWRRTGSLGCVTHRGRRRC